MNILICGLGLIGASLAKTLKKNTNHTVLGWNRTESVTEKALRDGVIDKTGDIDSLMAEADITFVNFYPEAIVPFILEHKNSFKKDSVVTDSCGIKTKICRAMEKEKLDFYLDNCTNEFNHVYFCKLLQLQEYINSNITYEEMINNTSNYSMEKISKYPEKKQTL